MCCWNTFQCHPCEPNKRRLRGLKPPLPILSLSPLHCWLFPIHNCQGCLPMLGQAVLSWVVYNLPSRSRASLPSSFTSRTLPIQRQELPRSQSVFCSRFSKSNALTSLYRHPRSSIPWTIHWETIVSTPVALGTLIWRDHSWVQYGKYFLRLTECWYCNKSLIHLDIGFIQSPCASHILGSLELDEGGFILGIVVRGLKMQSDYQFDFVSLRRKLYHHNTTTL